MSPASRAAVPLILALLVAAGAALRMAPVWQDPGVEPLSDAANHARLVRLAIAPGGLPAVDSLSNAPQGRRLAAFLPLGLYFGAAAFHRALAACGARDPRANLFLFIALSGALIVVPVYLGTRALFGDTRAALFAALVVMCMPAHVDRTFAQHVRFDAPGITLCALHAAFALRALATPAARGTPRSRVRLLESLASGLFLVLAVWMWRVSLALPVIESLFVLGWLVARGRDPAVSDWWTVVVAVATVGFLGVSYLREQHFVLSGAWLIAVAAAALLHVTPARAAGPARLALVAGAVALALAAGRWLAPPGAYGSILGALLARFRVWLDPNAPLTPGERLRLDVSELAGMSPLRFLIGIKDFFLVGPWCLIAPLWLRRAAAGGGERGPRPAAWLLVAWGVAFSVLTLLFVRNKALLAPFFAITAGGLFLTLGRDADRRWPRVAFLASAAATGVFGVLLATSRESRLEPTFAAALEALREHTPRDATVLCLWGSGYEIQAYAERRTVCDGLLESAENERRILEINTVFLADDFPALERLCRGYGATYVLVPPRAGIYSAALETGDALADRLLFGVPLAPAEARRTLMALMLGQAPAAFQPVFQSGDYRIYRFAPQGP